MVPRRIFMKILSWNIRGLNNPHKHDLLANMVRDNQSDIILIQETKMSAKKVFKIKNMFFKDCGCQVVDSDGASSGVETFWNPKMVVRTKLFSFENHVASSFLCFRENFSWVLSNIYAPNSKSVCKHFWDRLNSFKAQFHFPNWLVMGDFNTPLNDVDKSEGSQIVDDSLLDLLNFINDNLLLDLDLGGASYTWSNR